VNKHGLNRHIKIGNYGDKSFQQYWKPNN